jgi:translation initiation factor 2 subunit 2
MDYEKLLDEARNNLPESVFRKERFDIPKVRGHIQGNKTIINNFSSIATALRRPQEHLLKFVLKELATPGELKRTALIIGAKIPASRINDKIRQYANIYVLCKECGKPDTKISKENQFTYLKCSACGAKYTLSTRI